MRDDIDVFMSAYASAEDAFEWSYCLAIAPFEWKWGDEDVRLYLGESIIECLFQAFDEGMIREAQFKKELEEGAWLAVRYIHGLSEEEAELMKASFSPWEYAPIELALCVVPFWKVERALCHSAWFGNATFCKVADLWKK